MKTNYDSLKEHNESLARHLIAADASVKTFPEKAAVLYGKAMQSFLAVICSDNDIAFDRIGDLTPINMIGTLYSCGVISKYEKGVLDDIRYSAYLAAHGRTADKRIDSKALIEKIIAFFGMVMRYYHLEEETYSEDLLQISSYRVMELLSGFELDAAYDRVYLASYNSDNPKKEGYAVIAQYARDRSDFADEVFSTLESGSSRLRISAKSLVHPEIVEHQRGNNLIFVKSVIPRGFVKFAFDDFLPLMPEQRIKFIVNLARALYNIHSAGLSLSGFAPSDVWISFRGLGCVISGMESRLGHPMGTESSQNADVKSFAALAAALFPEYDKIPVAGLTLKHALMGSGKVSMEKLYFTLKKEALNRAHEPSPLSALVKGELSGIYRVLAENVLPPDISAANGIITDTEDENFSEMYSKVFGEGELQ